jgi:hypothetical protein
MSSLQRKSRNHYSSLYLLFLCREGCAVLKEQLKAKANWNQGSVEDCFRSWIQDRSVSLYAGLSGIMISNIWWARNSVVFKDKFVSPEVTATISLSQAEEFKEELRASKTQTSDPTSH